MHTSSSGKACVANGIYMAADKAEAELYRDQGLKGLLLRTRRPFSRLHSYMRDALNIQKVWMVLQLNQEILTRN